MQSRASPSIKQQMDIVEMSKKSLDWPEAAIFQATFSKLKDAAVIAMLPSICD